MDDMKKDLVKMPEKSVHVIVDVWLSRQKKSMLGIVLQYASAGAVKQIVAGLKDFEDMHKAEVIKTTINGFLYNELRLKPSQVRYFPSALGKLDPFTNIIVFAIGM